MSRKLSRVWRILSVRDKKTVAMATVVRPTESWTASETAPPCRSSPPQRCLSCTSARFVPRHAFTVTLPPFYRDIKNRRVDTKMAVFALPYNATLLSGSCSCSALLPLSSGSALPTDFRENVAGPCSNKTNPTLPPAGTGMRQNWHFRPFPLLPGATPSRCWGRAVWGAPGPGMRPCAAQGAIQMPSKSWVGRQNTLLVLG